MNAADQAQGAFHAGERAMQASVGLAERMALVGAQAIRDYMPQQHRDFFPLLPFLIVGSVDASAQPSASVLAAPAGFVSSPDERSLRIEAPIDHDDPLAANLHLGASLGVLGLEPHTRRRNRANGRVSARDEDGFTLAVQQSFGNCPKYIQAREPVFAPQGAVAGGVRISAGLDEQARALIGRADTFFIASAHTRSASDDAARAQGVDVSHRGGKPGFVRVEGNTLTVPDFRGNFFFNTLGNLLEHPQAGLLFIDFATGDLLQLAAAAEIITEGAELAGFVGAERLLRLRVGEARFRPAALPLRWGEAEISPVLAGVGAWPQST
ncbi:pyridoxamine 5'-phosphate oxidase family protein [Uliginosibacterium sp. H3]|uniref:Pyridoxamine 5'-phosphate oxidase family protein n=1 Tax=Uliginosibacterium silvisoli TaxID=3114758 RepID=A0ABU6K0P5_9RHOO|nr:pyridoxamine 5'-phosphate oxidase family protein [Uliginosibacterium sp. H3]